MENLVLPVAVILLAAKFILGGHVVIKSMIMELPKENDGRFWPFCCGALAYGLIILLIR